MTKFILLPLLFFLLTIGKINAQTSQGFKDAAFVATSKWNNQNLECKNYAKALEIFVKANAIKYSITSYKFYELKTQTQFINHDDFSKTEPISRNGLHVIAIINGEIFDNHHPKGATKINWDSKLICPAGVYPNGFLTTLISNIQPYN